MVLLLVLEKFSNYLYMIPLFVIGVLFLLILLKKRKEMQERLIPLNEEERESLANPIAITVLMFFTLIYVTFFGFKIIVPYPLDILTLIWYALFLVFFYFLCRREMQRYTGPPFEVKDEADLSIKYELIRKTTHAVIVLVVVCYTVFGPLFMFVVNWLLELIGLQDLELAGTNFWGQYTVAFFTVIAFLGLSTSEIVRVFFYPAYPLKAVKKIFRQKEIGAALGSHIALTVGCLSVILIFGPTEPQIVMASISISAIADGAASVVGKRFGLHKYRTVFSKKHKTFEGMLTETIVSLALSFLFLIYRFGIYSFLLAFIAALVIDFIDYLSIQVSDNLINPIASALALFLFAQLLRTLGLV